MMLLLNICWFLPVFLLFIGFGFSIGLGFSFSLLFAFMYSLSASCLGKGLQSGELRNFKYKIAILFPGAPVCLLMSDSAATHTIGH